MATVLVTGGCGLIGQHICSGLLKKGNVVISADREEGHYNTGKARYTFVQADPTDRDKYEEIFEKNKIDILVHAACTVDNDISNIVEEKQMSDCRSCDKFIYELAFSSGVSKIIMLSTSQVYEQPDTREPIREDHPLKPVTNYAVMKFASEKTFVEALGSRQDVICAILRFAPVYTHDYVDNLVAKITDPKSGGYFVYGKGQYGFQFCCIHNLVDFILCFVKNADSQKYSGVYNVGDKLLITALDIINFMRLHHRLGTVVQKNSGGTISKFIQKIGGSKEEKTNYRYLNLARLMSNTMLDNTKAAKLLSFRWDLHKTK